MADDKTRSSAPRGGEAAFSGERCGSTRLCGMRAPRSGRRKRTNWTARIPAAPCATCSGRCPDRRRGRAWCSWRWAAGNRSSSAITVATASIPPAAPSACPCIDLVELTASLSACAPNTCRMAAVSVAVVRLRAGAVSVDIPDLLRLDAGIADGHAHGPRRAIRQAAA